MAQRSGAEYGDMVRRDVQGGGGRCTRRAPQQAEKKNEGAGGNGRSPRKPADQRHRPARFPPMTRPGIEAGLPWWAASVLTALPPRPLGRVFHFYQSSPGFYPTEAQRVVQSAGDSSFAGRRYRCGHKDGELTPFVARYLDACTHRRAAAVMQHLSALQPQRGAILWGCSTRTALNTIRLNAARMLAVIIPFSATEDSYSSVKYLFQILRQAVEKIVPEYSPSIGFHNAGYCLYVCQSQQILFGLLNARHVRAVKDEHALNLSTLARRIPLCWWRKPTGDCANCAIAVASVRSPAHTCATAMSTTITTTINTTISTAVVTAISIAIVTVMNTAIGNAIGLANSTTINN
ncbi:hypothetical protein PR048_019400 [Dryococelus australis]|uniref:Uncharacterized protein n=1 Tax=Dryococelus australis TaxID=614101 RepID=A0ABQ9H3H7_9NEOP|nr:hypothetical protein PR048_019400 [Dryococelus australis]